MDILKNEEDFFNFLEVDKAIIKNIINNTDHYYKSFVKNKNGKKRRFHEAKEDLKKVQNVILKKILEEINLPKSMIGAVKGGSTKKNAELHKNKDFIIKLDIKDFFPSITPGRVFKLFNSLGFSKEISRLLVKLTTRWSELPQGVCTSNYIACLILRKMEKRFNKLCSEYGFTYSFYVDDITFSGNKKIKNFKNLLKRIVVDEGFKLKIKKEGMMSWDGRQEINNLIVNSGVTSVPKEKRKVIRAKIHNLSKNNNLSMKQKKSLYGEISYIKYINKAMGEKLLKDYNTKIISSNK